MQEIWLKRRNGEEVGWGRDREMDWIKRKEWGGGREMDWIKRLTFEINMDVIHYRW